MTPIQSLYYMNSKWQKYHFTWPLPFSFMVFYLDEFNGYDDSTWSRSSCNAHQFLFFYFLLLSTSGRQSVEGLVFMSAVWQSALWNTAAHSNMGRRCSFLSFSCCFPVPPNPLDSNAPTSCSLDLPCFCRSNNFEFNRPNAWCADQLTFHVPEENVCVCGICHVTFTLMAKVHFILNGCSVPTERTKAAG